MNAAQSFHCPTCGAPLHYGGGSDLTIQCPYCRASVVVPESLRSKNQTEPGENPANLGFASLERLEAEGNASITSVVVTNIGSGQPVMVSTPNLGSVTAASGKQVAKLAAGTVGATGCLAVALTIGVFLLIAVPILFAFIQPGAPLAGLWAQVNPWAYARVALSFGGEGSGQGLFQDPRSIGVDIDGNIYVGEYNSGRVQVFTRDGKFRALWPGEEDRSLQALAVGQDGTVYMAYQGDIHRYSAAGSYLGKIDYPEDWYFEDVIVTPDGGLLAVAQGETIVRLDANYQATLVIPDAVSSISRDSELDCRIAADGLGNIYVLGTFNQSVFKFAPDGRFLTRIGSPGDEPGQFRAPNAVAVDGQGRVYVADLNLIEIFDSEGRYLDRIQLEQGVAFGLVFNLQNELFAVTNAPRVLKFVIPQSSY